MSTGFIGAIIGLLVGVADFFLLRNTISGRNLSDQTRTIVKIVSYLSLIIFPIVGWYVGSTMFGVQ